MAPMEELNAVVSQKIDVSSDLIILRITPRDWDLVDFKPGQFTMIGLPPSAERHMSSDPDTHEFKPGKLIKRAYSVASSSISKEYLEFYIAMVRSGDLTPRLFNLKPGDSIWLSPKFTGMFTLEEVPAEKNIVLAATGTGVAPYISMIRTKLNTNEVDRIAIIHGARHSWDLGYRSELMTLSRMFPNFEYIPILDHPDEEPIPWKGEVGFIQDLWLKRPLNAKFGDLTPDNTHVFLCGNPLMIDAMMEKLNAEGFTKHTKRQPGQIHIEAF